MLPSTKRPNYHKHSNSLTYVETPKVKITDIL